MTSYLKTLLHWVGLGWASTGVVVVEGAAHAGDQTPRPCGSGPPLPVLVTTLALLVSLSARGGDGNSVPEGNPPADRPNILVVVADDMGFSDLGVFGSEINTPNLDRLADAGRLLTNFHVADRCNPTRAMLLSGTDNHLAGVGSQGQPHPSQRGHPGYQGYLSFNALSIAAVLRDAGYHTYMAGKWHLGLEADQSPQARGFESSFGLIGGAANQFGPISGQRNPLDPGFREGDLGHSYRENGRLTSMPQDFYSTRSYTDTLIHYIDENISDNKPFFAYAPYTAVHYPLQVPDDFINRYEGVYDKGYQAIREARIARQKQLGVIPERFEPSSRVPSVEGFRTWDQLSAQERKFEARRMEIYAAMVENLDYHVGRLIQYLKDEGKYENTFIFFMSDNGPEEDRPGLNREFDYDNSYDNMGRRGSYTSYGPRWAEVSAAPFRLWKAKSTEGGVRSPAIVRLPGQRTSKPPLAEFTDVRDVAPTLLDVAGVEDPGDTFQGRSVHPITGTSLLPVLESQASRVHPVDAVFGFESNGQRYIRQGDWKMVYISSNEPFVTSGEWQLYNMDKDPGETNNLAHERPEVVDRLLKRWEAYKERVGVVLPPDRRP